MIVSPSRADRTKTPIGRIAQIQGPVVNIACERLPPLHQALWCGIDGERYTFEVYQHLDEQHVRAITLHRTAGLQRGRRCSTPADSCRFQFRPIVWAVSSMCSVNRSIPCPLSPKRRSEASSSSPWLSIEHAGTLGLIFVFPVVVGAYLGRWLDGWSEGYSIRWTLSLIVLGILVGAVNAYQFVKD